MILNYFIGAAATVTTGSGIRSRLFHKTEKKKNVRIVFSDVQSFKAGLMSDEIRVYLPGSAERV